MTAKKCALYTEIYGKWNYSTMCIEKAVWSHCVKLAIKCTLFALVHDCSHWTTMYTYACFNQGRDREGLESSRSPLTPCSKPPKSYALICNCWPGGEIKERMKFQDLEFLHQKMVSQQLFAVPSNDFSSIVECVKSRTSEHKLV